MTVTQMSRLCHASVTRDIAVANRDSRVDARARPHPHPLNRVKNSLPLTVLNDSVRARERWVQRHGFHTKTLSAQHVNVTHDEREGGQETDG